jgi:hypothetical protein
MLKLGAPSTAAAYDWSATCLATAVYRWFAAWRDICLFEKINHALVIADREHGEAGQSIGRYRSKAESATRSSIPMGAASCSNRIRRVSRIATAADR